MSPDQSERRPPGLLWIVILGLAGFCAGFFGPMVFVPDSNIGPLVGILFSGPAGLIFGFVFWLVFRLAPASARVQWRLLAALTAAEVGVVLLAVQPEPALRGYVAEVEVRGQRRPAELADDTVAYWHRRVATVTWAPPRAGWEPQMRRALADDRGIVLDAVLVRQRRVMGHRKPWNRGRLFATPWEEVREDRSFYFPSGQLATVPAPGTRVRYFLPYDADVARHAPDSWPPSDVAAMLVLSQPQAVPAEYEQLE